MKSLTLEALIRALTLTVLVVVAFTILTTVWSLKPEPGVYLEFKFYKPTVSGYIEEALILRAREDVMYTRRDYYAGTC